MERLLTSTGRRRNETYPTSMCLGVLPMCSFQRTKEKHSNLTPRSASLWVILMGLRLGASGILLGKRSSAAAMQSLMKGTSLAIPPLPSIYSPPHHLNHLHPLMWCSIKGETTMVMMKHLRESQNNHLHHHLLQRFQRLLINLMMHLLQFLLLPMSLLPDAKIQ